jgi:cytochrome c553
MERGQHIWRAGLADRKVPACAACHAANGAGIPSEYPRLAGQHPAYIAEQLKLFRSGDRANSKVMFDIADRMSDSDIAAVSDYAAGLR